jgi:putative hydrolase of the HAD superfamily
MSDRFSAVFFDLGGTLFSYREVGRWTISALQASAQKLGVDAPMREVGLAYRSASREANGRYVQRPYYLHSDLFRDTFRLFAEKLDREATNEFLDFSERALRDTLIENMALRDDCLDTLQALKSRGLYLSIVSNIDDDHLIPMVERSGLDGVLDHWTSSEEAQSCKPDAGFFHLALKKAGCEADRVLFVGDSPEHDVQGASRVGMTTVLIAEGDAKPPLQSGREMPDPDHRIESLSELIALVG